MTKWPRLTRNKISSSKIEGTVEEIVKECEEQEIVELAKSLLTEWSSLQMAYRIPRRERKAVSEESGDDEKEGDTKTAESTEEVDTSGWPVKRDEPEPDQTSQTSNDYGSKSNLGYYSSQPPFKSINEMKHLIRIVLQTCVCLKDPEKSSWLNKPKLKPVLQLRLSL